MGRPAFDRNSRFARDCAMSRKLVIPRLNASGRAPRYSDVDLMLRSRPRIIMLDGGIPPATPLPTKHYGPEALRHCLATVLPRELTYGHANQPRTVNTDPYPQKSLPKSLCCQDHLAVEMRRLSDPPQAAVVYRSLPCGIVR